MGIDSCGMLLCAIHNVNGEEKNIRRIMDGVYEKSIYSKLLKEYIPANPDAVAYAIARSFRWTIAPCGDVALNKLGLSTQVPVV